MNNISRQNQNLETTQLANTSQNTLNLTIPQMGPSNIYSNPNNNPQFTQKFNPQFNPNFNPQFNPNFNPQCNPNFNPQCNPNLNPSFNQTFNPVINNNPNINVEVKHDLPKTIEIKTKRPISRPVKFGLESKKMNCLFVMNILKLKLRHL